MPTRIRVLTHEFYPQRGGIATYAESMARAATEAGYATEVWAPQRPELDAASFPFPVVPLKLRGSQDWPCRLRLAGAVKRAADLHRYTLYLPEPGPIRTWMYADELNLPRPKKLVITLHGSELFLLSRTPWRRKRFQRLLNDCHRIGVVSDYVRNELLQRFPLTDPDRCRRVPGAPPAACFDIAADRSPAAPFTFLCVGRIHPRKGVLDILKAMASMPPEAKAGCRLLTVGPVGRRWYFRKLSSFAKRHELSWEHLGTTDEAGLHRAYARAHALVMASRQHGHSVEGLGLVLLEAAAAGLPVITTLCGGTAEALRHNRTGLLVPPDRPGDLREAMLQLKSDTDKAVQMGQQGREWAREHFSWDRNVEALFGEIPE